MKVSFSKSFAKDLDTVKTPPILAKVKAIIETVEASYDMRSIDNLKKLKNQETYYRMQVGDYHLGLKIEQNHVTFMRFLHRREIYRYFP